MWAANAVLPLPVAPVTSDTTTCENRSCVAVFARLSTALALVAAAAVIWAVVRFIKASKETVDADAVPQRTGPSEAVLARYKKLDMAAKKNLIHWKNAARKKSTLAKLFAQKKK